MNELIDNIIAVLTGLTIDGEVVSVTDAPVDQHKKLPVIEIFPDQQTENIQAGGHPYSEDGPLSVQLVIKLAADADWRRKTIALADAVKHAWLTDADAVREWGQPTQLTTTYSIEEGSRVFGGALIAITYPHVTNYPPVIGGEYLKSVHTIQIPGGTP